MIFIWVLKNYLKVVTFRLGSVKLFGKAVSSFFHNLDFGFFIMEGQFQSLILNIRFDMYNLLIV